MDQQLKERLVGAAVLVALAAIFVPMVLDGPSPPAPPAPATLAPAPVDASTFGYDLNAPLPGAPATAAPAPRGSDEASTTVAAPATAVVAAPAAKPSTSTTVPKPAATTAPTTTTASPAPSPTVAAPAPKTSAPATGSGWAAQVGSFSKEATAKAIADDLKHRGFKAFVMTHREAGKTLYRVRVGPVATREAADALGKKITQQTGQAARPVKHP